MCGGDIPQDKAGPDPEDLVHPSGPLDLSSLLFLCHPGSDEEQLSKFIHLSHTLEIV